MEKIRRFSTFYRPHIKLFMLDFMCAVLLASMGLVFPRAVRKIIDVILPAHDLKALLLWGIGLALMYGLYYLLQYIVDYWGHVVGIRIEKDMRTRLFEHIHKLPFQFFDDNKTGQLMSRVVNDLNEISELAHHGPEDIFTAGMMFTGAFFIMFSMNWTMALSILAIIPFIIWFTIVNNSKMHKGFRKLREELGEINSQVEDSLSGVRVVKSFTNEGFENARFEMGNKAFTKAKQRAYYIMSRFHPGIELFNNFINLGVLIFGGYLVYEGKISYGDLIAFILYVGLFLGPIRKLANIVEMYQRGMASFSRYCEIMDITPGIRDLPGAAIMRRPCGDIVFDNVTFSYDNNTVVLKDISFRINSGETVAVVGPSGGGKTTLCNLIPRFYELDAGNIYIDGKEIRSVTLKSLRNNIGIVQQDVFLFAGTVRENIMYGRVDATEDEMVLAAKKADAHDFIMNLPQGYDTYVGERGVKLSGGQKQRLSIARIFLKNPPIIILDEATSSLDNETENIIQASLYKLSENRTTLVIAHRLATIRRADRIFVLTDEGIVEEGNHKSLLESNGIYARLYNAQFEV